MKFHVTQCLQSRNTKHPLGPPYIPITTAAEAVSCCDVSATVLDLVKTPVYEQHTLFFSEISHYIFRVFLML
jgi:hypothetical protein